MFALTIFVVKVSTIQLLKYYLTWHFYNKFTIANAYKVAKLMYYYGYNKNSKEIQSTTTTTTEEVKIQETKQDKFTLLNGIKIITRFIKNKVKTLF